MRIVSLAKGQRLSQDDLHRAGALPREVIDAAAAIVADVRERGDEALREYCLRFDGACPEVLRVSDEAIEKARAQVEPELLEALELAAAQIEDFHKQHVAQSWRYERPDGVELGFQIKPVASAALYVPGGRAQYPSTVLMDAIPAKVAGVSRVIMLTPPQADGGVCAQTLAAASVAGVDEVYAVGGAQAIAAAAYGTESIPAVDKIVGPGNAYVAAAKREVSGDVGIDMIAGPSEVCVLADATADPAITAADLMAQAEHDPMAASYLVTCDAVFAGQVLDDIEILLAQSPRAEITRASLDDNGVVVICEDMDDAIAAVNEIAPEHLEIDCADADDLVERIDNAGAIFVGKWSSEPLGDYVAGPNHTLPTGGTARFSNPLGVYDFQKRSSIIRYNEAGLAVDGPAVQVIAEAEGLWAHALSVGLRLRAIEEGPARASELPPVGPIAWPERG